MSEAPVTLSVLTKALAEFHRGVILPDIQRVVQDAVTSSEQRLESQLMRHIDGLAHKLTNLEQEVKIGFAQVGPFERDTRVALARIDARLDGVEARLKAVEGRLDRVEGRLAVLERQYADLLSALHRLEERLRRVEARTDQIAAAQEKLALKSEVAALAGRVDGLAEEVRRLEHRLGA